MLAFYNDIDPYCCEWLQTLIMFRVLPPGTVDDTPIQKLKPKTLSRYKQVHLFAGMGGWPYALRLAQWPDSRPVWTGSCPCQPFSVAGKGKGTKDKRHLWPYMRRLINHASPKPPVVFGEQVSGKAGLLWLAGVRTDLEKMEYEVGAVDSCAAGVGAPHIRQRLWWVAQSISRQRARVTDGKGSISNGAAGGWQQNNGIVKSCGTDDGLAHDPHWDDYQLIPCLDGKHRRIKSGLLPLAHGVPRRLSKLRAIGNSIVPELAAEFILSYLETIPPV